ncbi:MAG: winged helix-turn-helix domain-containing protein, partial [Colwelliaceae bacterium]|nr:winged helix-turn-helix domain-containing protein [Colwelliaceae bacterium]
KNNTMHYQFADLTLNTELRQLQRGNDTIKLTKLSYKVLTTLLSGSPNIIDHDELVNNVWGENRIITPENITQRIMMLRQSLGDNAAKPKYIESVHGVGFRIIPSVILTKTNIEPIAESKSEQNIISRPNITSNNHIAINRRKPSWIQILTSIIVLVVIATLLLPIFERDSADEEPNQIKQEQTPLINGNNNLATIAVLPFVNMTSDPEQEYFSDGITEEILNNLAQVKKLKVISRTSSFSFKNHNDSLAEIAKQLGVKNILEGSIRKDGNKIRITAQLIDAKTDTHLWSNTYDRELNDIFAVQDEISVAIVIALKNKLSITDIELNLAPSSQSAINLDAHNEYLRGRYFVEKLTEKDQIKALSYFNKSIELAKDYAPAWAGKALANFNLAKFDHGNVAFDMAKARGAAEKAISLDAELPEANLIMGIVEVNSKNNEKAIKYFKKAIALNPNYADAYFWYSTIRDKDSLDLLEKALQLNPVSLRINFAYGNLLRRTLQFDKAVEVAINMLDIDSTSYLPYMLLSSISRDENKVADHLIYYNKLLQLSPSVPNLINLSDDYLQYGLYNQALELLTGMPAAYDMTKYYIQKDFERAHQVAKEVLPRNKRDKTGAFHRAITEFNIGNFELAIKYFKVSEAGEPFLIYSYQQIGDSKSADELINQWKMHYQSSIEAGRGDLDELAAYIAFFENDINKMIKHLKQKQNKDPYFVLGTHYKFFPMYQKLTSHPKWQSLLEESDNRALKVRNRYLELVPIGAEKLARLHHSEKSFRPVEISVATEILEEYVGVYILSSEFSIAVTLEGGYLFMQGTGQKIFKLAPESEALFFSLTHNDKFSFLRNEAGKVISVIEYDKNFNLTYKKLL